MQLIQYNKYLISNVDTDGPGHPHQDTRSHSAEYARMRFQVFMG